MYAESKKLREGNLREREAEDNETWETLDKIREYNNRELKRIVETGMKHKAELTIG